MNGYIAVYKGKRIEVWADSLYAAKLEAIARLNVPRNKEHMVVVMLAQSGDKTVTHTPDF